MLMRVSDILLCRDSYPVFAEYLAQREENERLAHKEQGFNWYIHLSLWDVVDIDAYTLFVSIIYTRKTRQLSESIWFNTDSK